MRRPTDGVGEPSPASPPVRAMLRLVTLAWLATPPLPASAPADRRATRGAKTRADKETEGPAKKPKADKETEGRQEPKQEPKAEGRQEPKADKKPKAGKETEGRQRNRRPAKKPKAGKETEGRQEPKAGKETEGRQEPKADKNRRPTRTEGRARSRSRWVVLEGRR